MIRLALRKSAKSASPIDVPYEQVCRRATDFMWDRRFQKKGKRGPKVAEVSEEKLGRTH